MEPPACDARLWEVDMPRLTKRLVESIPVPENGYTLTWDSDLKGFGLFVTANGVRSYIIYYRTPSGGQHRITIGRHGVLTPRKARLRAKQLLGQIAEGGDPSEERRRARGEPTVRDLVEEYVERRGKEKKIDEDERILRKDIVPSWGHLPAKDIRRRDVIRLVDEVKDRGAGIMANRTLAVIKRLYNFGIARDLVETSPATLVKPPSRERRRDRVLSEAEIKKYWEKLEKTDVGELVRAALRLVLVTGQRSGEIVGAEWSEFDLESAWWEIPAERSKNGLPHRVPLSPLAIRIVEGLPTKDDRYLFPGRVGRGTSDHAPITSRSLSHALRRNLPVFGFDRSFTPHDLRRTAASHMASMGTSRLVVSKLLNHIEPGVTAVYDRYGYDREKRVALDAWSSKIEAILAGKKAKVLPLARS